MYINFDEFSNLLKENITLNEDDCFKILNKIINNPNRYVGVFRITGAKAKLMQNISQSNEIMFGNFLEKIINKYLKITGYVNLNNEIQTNGEILKKVFYFGGGKWVNCVVCCRGLLFILRWLRWVWWDVLAKIAN
nr:hypothetical protein [Mycoplasmopsis bovis]